jgi:hypothetical protein
MPPSFISAKTEWNMKKGFEHKPKSFLHKASRLHKIEEIGLLRILSLPPFCLPPTMPLLTYFLLDCF